MTLRRKFKAEAASFAAWLRSKTKLTDAQIAAWSGLTSRRVALIADDLRDRPITSPVSLGALTRSEIRRCEANPAARLEQHVAFFGNLKLTDQTPSAPLRKVRFHSAQIGETYFLTNSRNAWHSTQITQYLPGAISGRRSDAVYNAERQRTQGSSFVVERLPALVLQSDKLTLVGVEANESAAHRIYGDVFNAPLTAGRILERYGGRRRNTVLWLHALGNYRFAAWTVASPARWRSVPQPDWLDWHDLEGTASVSDDLRTILRRARKSIRLG